LSDKNAGGSIRETILIPPFKLIGTPAKRLDASGKVRRTAPPLMSHVLRPLMCYCVRNLYVTIRATMIAKISSAGKDFWLIGLVEWRAADRPG